MFYRLKQIFLGALIVGSMHQVGAFSLLGPLDTWQTTAQGFGLTGDMGGPMGLGEEYRWNSKVIVYAYSPAFLRFFGKVGSDAVDAKFKILNSIPAASAMSTNLAEFPLDTRRINFTAQALGLQDLGSWSLSMVLESLGLANPERYIYNIYAMDTAAPPAWFTTIRRNFDPITLQPSSYVNGTLYTYRLVQTAANQWEALEFPVDPESPTVTSVVGLASTLTLGSMDAKGLSVVTNTGFYYDGITRDDAGALRYLLNPQNLNVENLPADAMTGAVAVNTGPSGQASSGSSPWTVPPAAGAATAAAPAAGGAAAGGAAAAPAAGTVTLLAQGVRKGVDKIKFVRGDYESLLGQGFTNLVTYTESVFINGALQTQTVQRLLTTPDILFDVDDLGVDATGLPVMVARTAITFQNNSALSNGDAPGVAAGPGTIAGQVVLTFNRLGPGLFNPSAGDETGATPLRLWGSFDGSTNAPTIYPDAISTQQIEKLILKSGSPWRVPDAAAVPAAAGGGAAAGAAAPAAPAPVGGGVGGA